MRRGGRGRRCGGLVRRTIDHPCAGKVGDRRLAVFHEDGDSAVRWVFRVALDAQKLVGVAAHLGDLVGAHTVLLQQAPGGVGAIRGELPVAVRGIRGVRRRVGVALNEQSVGQRLQLAGQQRQQLLSAVTQARAAALIESAVLVLKQLDPQTLRSDGDLDLLGELFQFLARLDLLFELFFQLLHIVVHRLGYG